MMKNDYERFVMRCFPHWKRWLNSYTIPLGDALAKKQYKEQRLQKQALLFLTTGNSAADLTAGQPALRFKQSSSTHIGQQRVESGDQSSG